MKLDFTRLANRIQADNLIMIMTGEDYGVVEDTAQSVLKTLSESANNAQVTWLPELMLSSQYVEILERLEAADLWGSQNIFCLRLETERYARHVINLLKTHDKSAFPNTLLILARKIAPKGALAKYIQSTSKTELLRLSGDTSESLAETLQAIFDMAGAAIDSDALEALSISYLGHRGLAKQEAEKLSLYALALGRALQLSDLEAALSANAAFAFRDLVYPVLGGQSEAVLPAYRRLETAGKAPISMLRACQNEVQRMIAVKLALESGDRRPEFACKPPVFKTDWPEFQQRLGRWSLGQLLAIQARIAKLEAQTRLDQDIVHSTLTRLLCDIAAFAKRTTH